MLNWDTKEVTFLVVTVTKMGMVGVHSAITTYWKGTFSIQFNHYPLHLILGPNYGACIVLKYCGLVKKPLLQTFRIAQDSRFFVWAMVILNHSTVIEFPAGGWRYCFAPMDPWQLESSWAATNSVNSSSAWRKFVARRHTTACNYTLSSFKDTAVMEPNFSQTNHPTKTRLLKKFSASWNSTRNMMIPYVIRAKKLVKSSHESETTTIFTLLFTLSPSAVRESYEWRWQRRDCWGIFQACGALITHLIWRLIGFATVHVINNNSLFGSRIPNHDFSIFWALGQQQCIEPKHENMLSMLYGEAVMDRKPPRKTHGQKLARFRQTLHYHHLSGL